MKTAGVLITLAHVFVEKSEVISEFGITMALE